MADVEIDILAAHRAGAQELGRQIAELTTDLAIQRSAVQALTERVKELEEQLPDEEIAAPEPSPDPSQN